MKPAKDTKRTDELIDNVDRIREALGLSKEALRDLLNSEFLPGDSAVATGTVYNWLKPRDHRSLPSSERTLALLEWVNENKEHL